ncbi:ABC transporter ATP-binding protein [Hydromonas duriensis]|uniref:Spermidine/putrescine import ATP-binding protein PotA n=1 Tax=Hydromonas duriensis TaxID=1527608 RepID=A0A4R6Y428_9BURK|nr:ABC transporter ATP-binding protein [Hydromonas duriensis]TDR31155.1 spermidine/putrescine ABC transporter ATP-binding subunit [Hydromonas duriensis]
MSAQNPKQSSNPSFLSIENLEKKFGDHIAVNKVSIDIGKGDIFALLGSSGCGKSTLLRMLAGFETPTSGRILLEDKDITAIPPYLRPINMMFQSYALFPHLSVWDNIAFGLRRDGLPKDVIANKIEHMLKLTQLSKYAKRKPHQLSGGQQQRVALARSLAKEPQLLLLDEPLGALDKKLREETQLELVNIIEKVGVTCVMVTHDQEEAMTMASRIAVMSEGRFLQVGSPREIYEMPQTEFVADFIGNVNLFQDGEITVETPTHAEVQTEDALHVIDHAIAGELGGKLTIAIRPEKMELSRNAPEQRGNQCHGVIKEMAYYGSDTLYHIQLDNTGKMIKVQIANTERFTDEKLTWEDAVYVSWTSDAIVPIAPSYQ